MQYPAADLARIQRALAARVEAGEEDGTPLPAAAQPQAGKAGSVGGATERAKAGTKASQDAATQQWLDRRRRAVARKAAFGVSVARDLDIVKKEAGAPPSTPPVRGSQAGEQPKGSFTGTFGRAARLAGVSARGRAGRASLGGTRMGTRAPLPAAPHARPRPRLTGTCRPAPVPRSPPFAPRSPPSLAVPAVARARLGLGDATGRARLAAAPHRRGRGGRRCALGGQPRARDPARVAGGRRVHCGRPAGWRGGRAGRAGLAHVRRGRGRRGHHQRSGRGGGGARAAGGAGWWRRARAA